MKNHRNYASVWQYYDSHKLVKVGLVREITSPMK